jgi:protein TonB
MPKTAQAMPGRVSTRALGLAIAALLQVGFVYALVEGLDLKVVKIIADPIEAFLPKTKILPPPPPPAVTDRLPVEVFVPQPDLSVEGPPRDTAPSSLSDNRPQTAGPADHGPVALMATHTIPPYPAMEQRLGAEGTVLLHLVIAPDGRVAAAQLIRSSGHERLDQAAIAWVVAHWRYQPALRGGQAVESAANVAVTFNLRN